MQNSYKMLILCASLSFPLSQAHADGINAAGNTLPIGAGGNTVLTIQGNNLTSTFAGPVVLNGILNAPSGININNYTFLNPDGTSTFSNTATFNSAVNLRSDVEIGTEGNGYFMPVGSSEFGPQLHIGGATTSNTDPIYFQRFNENWDTTSLRLVIGDNYGSPYVPGSSTTAGDAFQIGSLDSANGSYAWVPNFTFTSDGKIGIGTTTPQATLDVENSAGNATIVQNGKQLYPMGGIFTKNIDGSCRYGNPLAGSSCACPAGYTAYQIYDFVNPSCTSGFYSDSWRTSNCGIEMFQCL